MTGLSYKGRLSKEIHNHKEFLLFPHDMTDNDFVVERYMQDFKKLLI